MQEGSAGYGSRGQGRPQQDDTQRPAPQRGRERSCDRRGEVQGVVIRLMRPHLRIRPSEDGQPVLALALRIGAYGVSC